MRVPFQIGKIEQLTTGGRGGVASFSDAVARGVARGVAEAVSHHQQAERLAAFEGVVRELLAEARQARGAIRHALQFLRDPKHRGDGHLDECIAACEKVLETDGKWEEKDKR